MRDRQFRPAKTPAEGNHVTLARVNSHVTVQFCGRPREAAKKLAKKIGEQTALRFHVVHKDRLRSDKERLGKEESATGA